MKTDYIEFRVLLLSFFIIPFFTVYSQTIDEFCATPDPGKTDIEDLDCGPDPNGTIQLYWDIDTYKPMMDGILLHNSPIKTINVNFNVFQKQNGTGNYENIPEDKARLIQILDWVNDKFANYAPSDDVPGVIVDELPNYDTKIRFSLGNAGSERIYYYQNDDLFCETSFNNVFPFIEAEDPERLNQLNICFTGGFYGGHVYTENIYITNGGSGYNSEPDVVFSGNGYAQAECSIQNGSVVSIEVTNYGGSYYGCAPDITFEGGGGSGAEAYCTLGGGYGGYAILPTEDLENDLIVMNFANNGNAGGDFSKSTNLTHELGHFLEINHIKSPTACENDDDYLWDVFGLPNPGNCPHNSSCEDSWASTDDGCTNNIMGNKESHYISPRQAGKMHRSLALLTARRYVNEDVYIEDAPINITSNEVWDFNIKLYRDIIVKPGATLTITCKVVMPWQGRIIVEPSGKLIIDGGTVTTDSKNHLWSGIEVQGDASVHQYEYFGPCAQGKLILKNGAVIENAWIGVLLGGYHSSSGNWNSEKAGGIVQVIDNNSLTEPAANFINNAYTVHFLEYENFYPNPENIRPNQSYFSNALFEVNDDYLIDESWDYSHVLLYGVSGVRFRGCTFTNESSSPNLGRGIYCAPGPGKWNSCGFDVSGLCQSTMSPCPEESLDKCRFENFKKGIEVINSGTSTFTVQDAIFENNSYGIKMSNTNNASVLFSEFYIGPASSSDKEACDENSSGYGIFMDNCTGFAIEENYFTKYTGAPTGNYTGIRIAETNATDEIYLNYFDGLSYANYTEGKNWFGSDINMGLEYLCNENQDNFADFYVINDPVNQSGIQAFQGDPIIPAGNEFSPTGANFHILNLGDHNINYYYCGSGALCPNQEPVYGVGIFNSVASTVNQCLTHHGGGGGHGRTVLDEGEKQEREQQYAQALTDYNNVTALYESLKDGGNTEVLKTEVETAWPSDMWELRTELLGKSPHLSMEVLKEAADKTDVLPESVLFEILAANPDELKKEELLKYLEDKENPLPQYMIDILKQVAAGTTYKTVLQNQMSDFNQLKTRAAHDMIRSILNDTITDLSELRNWLDNLGGIRADHQIINTYLAEGDYNSATSLADMLPDLYKLSGNELEEHNYYLDVLNLKIDLKQQGRTFSNLTTDELNQLIAVAENSERAGGAEARGILESNYDYDYCDCLKVEDHEGYKSSPVDPSSMSKVYGITINVDPNPAKKWTAFNYSLPDNIPEGVIKISDVSGKVVESFTVSGVRGQKIWDTRSIKPGIYFYTFVVNGIAESGKIVISK